MTTRPLRPSRYPPPYVSGSRRLRNRRVAGRISRPPSFPRCAGRDLLAETLDDRPDRPLECLQRDVPREPVGDDHVARTLEQQPSLDVATEVERAGRQQLVRLQGQLVALLVLLADREQTHPGSLDLEDLLGEHRAHVTELEEMLGTGVRPRAGVDQHRRAPPRRDHDGDPRPVDSRQSPDVEQTRRRASRRCCPPTPPRRPTRRRRRGPHEPATTPALRERPRPVSRPFRSRRP